MNRLITIVFLVAWVLPLGAQQAPQPGENFESLMTFGKSAPGEKGDDDHTQIFFILIPAGERSPIYIRVFDPNIDGTLDEKIGEFDTKTKFSIYGGEGAFTNPDARQVDPVGQFDSGNLLATKTFGKSSRYDYDWYTFGPFNPSEGEDVPSYKGRVFKIIVQGLEGDDGNAYKFFLTTRSDDNVEVQGANFFTYEYTVRLKREANTVAHLYPYMDSKTIKLTQRNFDFDIQGHIRIVGKSHNNVDVARGANGKWGESTTKIFEDERNGSIDIQIYKQSVGVNTFTINVANQRSENLAFFAIPLGGVPKYDYDINIMYLGQ